MQSAKKRTRIKAKTMSRTMGFDYAVDELQKNLEELKKQHRLRRLRQLLKFLLIGFFIYRDSEKRIPELTARSKLIIGSLFKRFEDLEHSKQHIRELVDAFSHLIQIGERMEEFKDELADAQNLIIYLEDNLRKYHELVVSYTKGEIEQREYAVDKKVEGILNSGTYLTYNCRQNCIDAIKSFEEDLNYIARSETLDSEYIIEKKNDMDKYRQTVLNYNRDFIQQRKRQYSYLWNKEHLSLDDEQQTAVVTDDKHNLVVAAAGSGKTEVLITRIAYLIERKPDTIQPDRILAIAYQRKAREEIEDRLRNRYKIRNVNVRTFHKLGKDIIEETGKEIRRTDIVDGNKKHEVVQKIFDQKIANEPDFYKLFLEFVKTLHDRERKEDFRTKEEALIYARECPYYAIDGTRVNSRAEKEIMDFFLMNKINGKPIAVRYEPDVDGFRPDFYLPKYDLFVEHWGLNEKGEVPEWFSQSTEEYKKSMEIKKKWFAEHDKLLVETFAHEHNPEDPDRFIELLKKRIMKKLKARHDASFESTLKTYKEIINIAWHSYRTPIDDIVNFITTAKTYGLTPTRIAEKLRKNRWTSKQIAFGNLALPIYSKYEEVLREYEKIDFEDMINNAIDELDKEQNLRADVYDHILIDEYQDISAQRCKLIKKLMEHNPKCKLFCVGDDWQSIMGFSGSNLSFFVNFKEHFENPAMTKISTNYRSIKTIVDAGAELIKNNTSCQIQKSTVSNCRDVKPIKVLKSPQAEFERDYHQNAAKDCLTRITQYIQKGYSPRDILVLSRCMRTRTAHGYRFLSNVGTFIETAKKDGVRLVYGNVAAQNRVRLLTAHKSKGLEAKIVFLLNVTQGMFGFPCEIEDPSIYEPARENYPPQDNTEEERRLFYVAMTRAMEDLYIYTWETAMSKFLDEIADYTTEERLNYRKPHVPKYVPEHQSLERSAKKQTKSYSVNGIRKDYPRAYEKWTPEEDKALAERYKQGDTIPKLAKMHERKVGAIRSRLKKLGLLERERFYVV